MIHELYIIIAMWIQPSWCPNICASMVNVSSHDWCLCNCCRPILLPVHARRLGFKESSLLCSQDYRITSCFCAHDMVDHQLVALNDDLPEATSLVRNPLPDCLIQVVDGVYKNAPHPPEDKWLVKKLQEMAGECRLTWACHPGKCSHSQRFEGLTKAAMEALKKERQPEDKNASVVDRNAATKFLAQTQAGKQTQKQ